MAVKLKCKQVIKECAQGAIRKLTSDTPAYSEVSFQNK